MTLLDAFDLSVNMNVQDVKILAEALGGAPSLMDHIDTRNVADTE